MFKKKNKFYCLEDYCSAREITEEGILLANSRQGFILECEGLDASFLSREDCQYKNSSWRSLLSLSSNEELQIIYRKRVEFEEWVSDKLKQTFANQHQYARRIALDRLMSQIEDLSSEPPRILSQRIFLVYWLVESLKKGKSNHLKDTRQHLCSKFQDFGFRVWPLHKNEILREICVSAQSTLASKDAPPEWPRIEIEPDQIKIDTDVFRAVELSKLPEDYTEFGMIQTITSLPYPMDICLHLKGKEHKPVVDRLEKKRNLLKAKLSANQSRAEECETQIDQIDQILRELADRSEEVFDLSLTVGFRLPEKYPSFQRTALSSLLHSRSPLGFAEFEELTLSNFDAYLESIPSFSGRNLKNHTVLTSNAIHFLPFFRVAKGDKRPIVGFQTRSSTFYGIDPVEPKLANFNWLVSGTSGAGKSFFVNSLLAQSLQLDPNIFIVDIGGSYNKLAQFLKGQVFSLDPKIGFKLSPIFLPKCSDKMEESLRRQHVYQIFLEMLRIDGQLPQLEIRHLLKEKLENLLDLDQLPTHPISYLCEHLKKIQTLDAKRLSLLLEPWTSKNFFGNFLDTNQMMNPRGAILAFDLKGLTDFEDLSRVLQMILCSMLWAKIRQSSGVFSWIVLDEVAFSLLKTQSAFVDELVSTLRKYYAGAIIVVQDLEKITSNPAGASILQNTQSKAILQQRGNPTNYCEPLSLSKLDMMAIESLQRKKGYYSDIFLMRDQERSIIRYQPSSLEYWLSTSDANDNQIMKKWMNGHKGSFQNKVIDLAASRRKRSQK